MNSNWHLEPVNSEDGKIYASDQPAQPPFPASLMKEASRQVDLEEAVRWERDRRGLPKDDIDDWKRRSSIYAYLLISVLAGVLFVLLAL